MTEPKALNPWMPITDRLTLAHIGKAGEECAELSKILWRIVIQGVEECEPVTRISNRQALRDEIADVRATLQMLDTYLGQEPDYEREDYKVDHLTRWHDLIRNSGCSDDQLA